MRPDRANRRVAKPMSAGTTAVKAAAGVATRSSAPPMLPPTQISTRPTNERSQRGRRSRSATAAIRLPGDIATVFEALATIAGSPAASIAGKVMSEAPPTMAVTTPPARPAANSRRTEVPSMRCRDDTRARRPGRAGQGDRLDAAEAAMATTTTAPAMEFAADHDTPVPYMQRTRDYYQALGYAPYRWAHYADVPFTPLVRPLTQARVGLITTAAPF